MAASPIENARVDESAIVKIGLENSLTALRIRAEVLPGVVDDRVDHHDIDVLGVVINILRSNGLLLGLRWADYLGRFWLRRRLYVRILRLI